MKPNPTHAMHSATPSDPVCATRLAGALALVVLLLAMGCHSPATTGMAGGGYPAAVDPTVTGSLPAEAWNGPYPAPPGEPGGCLPAAPMGPPGMEMGVPCPYAPLSPWVPPGKTQGCGNPQPWPDDEYLCDGGDRCLSAKVMPDWRVLGLDPEDTVAHFDTLDGETIVEPSNRVCIYAPRFSSVRKVSRIVEFDQRQLATAVHKPQAMVLTEDRLVPGVGTQNVAVDRQVGNMPPIAFESWQGTGILSSKLTPRGFDMGFKPYENVAAIRMGIIDSAEMPFLAKSIESAIPWTHNQAVQIILDRQAANVVAKDDSLGHVFQVDEPPPCPKLRIIKVASTQFAEPGDEVDFTLRYDNIGNETIGNVTVIDNLTTRLEYIPDSAQSSRDAQFFTQVNDAGSLVLRWEITDPLPVGQGGVVRFRTRVR